jgi:uncharacterized membrane protein YiaA
MGAMQALGIALMGVGVLMVGLAFAPQIENEMLRYGLTFLGPCVGGVGAWLRQRAARA